MPIGIYRVGIFADAVSTGAAFALTRGFAGGVRPALRGAKAGHLRVAYLYWRVDWCREVETHKIKEY